MEKTVPTPVRATPSTDKPASSKTTKVQAPKVCLGDCMKPW
jgi:hypothetical protein